MVNYTFSSKVNPHPRLIFIFTYSYFHQVSLILAFPPPHTLFYSFSFPFHLVLKRRRGGGGENFVFPHNSHKSSASVSPPPHRNPLPFLWRRNRGGSVCWVGKGEREKKKQFSLVRAGNGRGLLFIKLPTGSVQKRVTRRRTAAAAAASLVTPGISSTLTIRQTWTNCGFLNM